MSALKFTWDETKNRSNQKKHDGVTFEEACQVFNDPLHVSIQDRIEGGEQRWQTFGLVGNCVLLIVAHTIAEEGDDGRYIEVIRIISARRADRKERKWYENENG